MPSAAPNSLLSVLADASVQVTRLARALGEELPAARFAAYAADLAEVPVPLLEEAVTVLLRTEARFPSLARVRAVCAELALCLPTADEALAQVDARIRWGRGHAGSPPGIHPLVTRALGLVGGYSALREAQEASAARGQLARVYRELRAEAIREAQVRPEVASHRRELSPSASDHPPMYPATCGE